jgi:hypothetical protein
MKIISQDSVFIFDRPLSNSWKLIVKRITLPFLDVFYRILLRLRRPSSSQKKYKMTICCIFKDEANFMKEWIEYHKLIGIEHFYMYNNNSGDHFVEILEPYIQAGVVTLIDWPAPKSQFPAYKNWFETFRMETQWVSFLDLDEFICPKKASSVGEWVDKYQGYPCIIMYWRMFGTSGQIYHNHEKLVTEQYTISWDRLFTNGKVFFNTDFEIANFDSFMMHHATTAKLQLLGLNFVIPPVNEFGYFVRWDIHRAGRYSSGDSEIQVNHYWSKSYMEYQSKSLKTHVCFDDNPKLSKDLGYFFWHEKHNISTDFTIYRFLILLKDALGLIPRS